MNTFLIGRKVRILHYPDFSGRALLSYADEEYPIPAAAAKEIIETLRSAQNQRMGSEPAVPRKKTDNTDDE